MKPNSEPKLTTTKSKPIQPRNSNLNHIQSPNLKMKKKKLNNFTLYDIRLSLYALWTLFGACCSSRKSLKYD